MGVKVEKGLAGFGIDGVVEREKRLYEIGEKRKGERQE